MQKYYPDWIMRLYTDYDIEDPTFRKLCDLACDDQYSYLDICHVKQLPGTPLSDASKIFGMNWRFFPTLDPQVFINYCNYPTRYEKYVVVMNLEDKV